MTANLLELRGITKRFSGALALHEVDLTLRRGQILALLGENGAGKSTLMKILSGVHCPDAGTITLDGGEIELRSPDDAQERGISIIHQEFSLVPYLTVVENIFLGRERTGRFGVCDKRAMRDEARIVLDRLGAKLSLDTPVAQLSVAEQQFVEIAKALLRQTRILIMDEPTATLTPTEAERLFRVMRDLKDAAVSIIFISHHLDEIFTIADAVVCLRDGRVVGESSVTDCSRESLIRLMVGRNVNQTYPPKADGPRREAGLEVRLLQRKPHLPEVAFTVRAGEILGVAGLVGSGRTKLIRALIGADPAHRHEVYHRDARLKISNPADARRMGIGLVPEDRKRQGLILDASVPDNLLLPNLRGVCHPLWRFIDRAKAGRVTRDHLRALGVKTNSALQLVRTLSGGNQQKIVIAKWLNAGCEVLIFDEPTRGIDVGAKAEIYRLMRDLTARGFAIIMISSELPEVIGLSDCVMVMRRQRIERFFDRGEPVTAESIMACATGGQHA